LKRIADGTISNSGAKEVFRTLWSEGGDADAAGGEGGEAVSLDEDGAPKAKKKKK
jgi:Asp-tRNA(Asn)/Glu-tRNA(Gln) amidotransferase B subunit